ncbi:MAG: DUF3857 domain-containing protein [Pseudomonadota bacterium]
MFSRYISVILTVFGLSSPAISQNVTDYAETGPVAPWVIRNDIPNTDFDFGEAATEQFLLVDKQRRVTPDSDAFYSHFASRLPSASAVEENSTITVNFDPTYERVIFHSVQLRRDDKVIDLLDLADFDVYRKETERDRLIYNGDLQLAYVVPGVRTGDVLEYAFTVVGRNPALGAHFFGAFQHQYGVPVQKMHQRFSHPKGVDVTIKGYHNPTAPVQSSADGYASYTWETSHIAARDTENNTPYGFDGFPATEFSSFKDWAEVGAHFHPFYNAANFQTESVRAVAATIKGATADRSEQLRAALDFVQQEVRYLGIELGAGGYVPRAPDLVLERRYGDCKDMVVLLNAILKALDIEAFPLLVDSDYRENVAESVPTYAAFDHVITMAKLDGKTYFLDPTRGPQVGDLDHLQQADFGKGVVIAADGPGMISSVPPRPEWQRDTTDLYDLTDADVAKFRTTTVMRMAEADALLSRRERYGLQEIADGYFSFYQRSYPTIGRDEPMTITVDHDAGKVTLTASYLIPNYWETDEGESKETFGFGADEISSVLPEIERSDRQAPYALNYPTAVQHKLVLKTNSNFGVSGSKDIQTAPGMTFVDAVSTFGGTYQQTFSYRVTEPQISPEDVAQHMDLAEKIDDEIWLRYTRPETSTWGATFMEFLSEFAAPPTQ